MKSFILAILAAAAVSTPAFAQFYGTGSNSEDHQVQGHYNRNGTYVQPHYSTNPNSTQNDNYNTRGNYNYHNGQTGNRSSRY
jgi:hypothetical protein